MKTRAVMLGVVLLAVLAGALYLWGPSSAPPGQTPLLTLTSANFAAFGAAFDAGANSSRLVLLLSPT